MTRLALILAAFAISVLAGMAHKAPLEHDEAVYASMSRQPLRGTPANQAGLQRPPGLPAIGTLALAVRDSDGALRTVGLLGGLGAVASLFFLGRSVMGEWPAFLAAGAFAASPSLQYRSGQFLNDVPSAALLFITAAMLWRSFENPGHGRGLYAVSVLVSAAFYLRYASVLPILLLGLCTLLFWRKRLRIRRLVGPIGLLIVLLIPHIGHSVKATGTPWGILVYAARFPAHWRRYPGHALIEYAKWLPAQLAGVIAGLTVILGLSVLAVMAIRGRRFPGNARAVWFLLLPALLQTLVLGIANHPEERFLFFPIGLLALVGAHALWSWKPTGSRSTFVLLVVVGLALAPIFVVLKSRSVVRLRTPLAEAARSVARLDKDNCTAVSVDGPVVIWYAGCTTYSYSTRVSPSRIDYLFVVTPHRFQPAGRDLDVYLSKAEQEPIVTVRNEVRSATVYRLGD